MKRTSTPPPSTPLLRRSKRLSMQQQQTTPVPNKQGVSPGRVRPIPSPSQSPPTTPVSAEGTSRDILPQSIPISIPIAHTMPYVKLDNIGLLGPLGMANLNLSCDDLYHAVDASASTVEKGYRTRSTVRDRGDDNDDCKNNDDDDDAEDDDDDDGAGNQTIKKLKGSAPVSSASDVGLQTKMKVEAQQQHQDETESNNNDHNVLVTAPGNQESGEDYSAAAQIDKIIKTLVCESVKEPEKAAKETENAEGPKKVGVNESEKASVNENEKADMDESEKADMDENAKMNEKVKESEKVEASGESGSKNVDQLQKSSIAKNKCTNVFV